MWAFSGRSVELWGGNHRRMGGVFFPSSIRLILGFFFSPFIHSVYCLRMVVGILCWRLLLADLMFMYSWTVNSHEIKLNAAVELICKKCKIVGWCDKRVLCSLFASTRSYVVHIVHMNEISQTDSLPSLWFVFLFDVRACNTLYSVWHDTKWWKCKTFIEWICCFILYIYRFDWPSHWHRVWINFSLCFYCVRTSWHARVSEWETIYWCGKNNELMRQLRKKHSFQH